ncbi:hypothetical protein N8Z76_00290 [Gammaproteobacteria bacterium]|nr:hypothetical protein [Gammaproteobacteria bacterium]
MANTISFTSLAPLMYKAMQEVAREQIGAINGVTINASGVDGAAFGDTVKSLIVSEASDIASYTPAMTVPAAGDKTNTLDSFALDSFVGKDLAIVGETSKRLSNVGLYGAWIQGEFAQIFRSVFNEIEESVLATIYKGASRAVGAAGTTPFASNTDTLVDLKKVMDDNGVPKADGQRTFVMDSSAEANIQKLTNLQAVNQAGDGGDLLRRGAMGSLHTFNLRSSAGIQTHTKGTATGYDATAAFAVGDETITVDGSDAGTILNGDVVTFAGDSNKYIVKSATADGAASGNIILNNPGLQATLADTVEGTTGATYAANVGFHRRGVELAIRPPAQPEGGDIAKDRFLMSDPVSGLSLEFALYLGYGMNKIEAKAYYGSKVWNPHLVATLMG